MADRPDPGKPDMPQLRRFRMDPDGSGRAHEIEPTRQLPTQGRGDSGTGGYDDPALDDPDALLRETDADLGHGWQPTDAPTRSAATADATTRLPESLEPRRPEPPAPAQAAGWDQPPAGPPGGPTDDDRGEGKKRNVLPMVIAAIAALAIIALVLWFFVFSPSGDSNNEAPTSETTQTTEQSEQNSESGGGSEQTQSEGNSSEEPGRDKDDGGVRESGGVQPTMPGEDNGDDDAPQSEGQHSGASSHSGQPTMPGGTGRD
ncbi:hypothetical protein EK0264_14885 [Epidermidibacterium keratini]|uniref:Uncharacterized protein n=1 Tax=Epidermidibacterium keratini TaxID=1891644 RepID=A0A7L4YQA1_9ACTN|nr:hypothetical protein [Epidermidibacterium keratini]QHC01445.1 hypothetical protein EK0264_14885 [Epidermidibacterium keratini]